MNELIMLFLEVMVIYQNPSSICWTIPFELLVREATKPEILSTILGCQTKLYGRNPLLNTDYISVIRYQKLKVEKIWKIPP